MRFPSEGQQLRQRENARRTGPSNSDAGLSIGDILRMLLGRKWLILATTLVCAAIAFLYTRFAPPVFEASAVIRIDPGRASSLGLGDLGVIQGGQSSDAQTEIAVIQTEQIAIKALNSLSDADFKHYTGSDKSRIAIPADSEVITSDQQSLLNAFRYTLHVKPVGDTQLVSISFRDSNAQLAATIANHVVAAYLRENFDSRYGSVTQASKWLSEQMTGLKSKVADAQEKLAAFQEQKGMLGTETSNTTTDTLKLFDQRLATAEADRIVKEAQMRAAADGNPAALASLFPDPKLNALQTSEGNLYSQYAQLSAKFGANYTPLMQLKKQMADIDLEITRDAQLVRTRLKEEYLAAKNNEDMMREEYNNQLSKAYLLNRQEAEFAVLQAEGTSSRELFNTLELKLQQAEINAGLNGVNTMPLDIARAPLLPIAPEKALIIPFGAVLGLVIGIGSVFLVELSANTIQNVNQIQAATGYFVLGSIPHLVASKTKDMQSALRTGTVTLGSPNAQGTESFRRIRGLLLQSFDSASPKTLMIASAQQDEGKSTFSSNLSIVLAQAGARVLLIDAELRRPTLHQEFSIENGAGFGDCLQDGQIKPQFHQPLASLLNLSLLTAGHSIAYPSEALASVRCRALLKEWESEFDFLLVKAAPFLVVGDSLPLASWSDGVILVTRMGITPMKSVEQVRELLTHVDAKVAGVVINDVKASAGSSSSYADYGRQG